MVRRGDRKEKAAIVFEGNWIYGYLQTDFPSVRFSVNLMVRGKARGNLGFNVAYSIGKDSSNKKAAWRLLRFLAGKQGQAVWVKNSGYLPGRSDVTAPAGRANFLREAPYAALAVREGLPARARLRREGARGDVQRRPVGRTDARRHQPRDAGRDRQKQVTLRRGSDPGALTSGVARLDQEGAVAVDVGVVRLPASAVRG